MLLQRTGNFVTSLLFSVITFITAFNASASSTAFVRAEAVGQGILLQSDGSCFVVVPTHVLMDAQKATVTLNNGTIRSAVLIGQYEPDISILKLLRPAPTCTVPNGENQDFLFTQIAVAEMSVLFESGLQRNHKMKIEAVNEKFFLVRPTEDSTKIRQGMSGAVVKSNGAPIGQLQTVDPETGMGKVIRFDYLLAVSEPILDRDYLENNSNPPNNLPKLLSHSLRTDLISAGQVDKIFERNSQAGVSLWRQNDPLTIDMLVYGTSYPLYYSHNSQSQVSSRANNMIVFGRLNSSQDWAEMIRKKLPITNSKISIGRITSGLEAIRIELQFSEETDVYNIGTIKFTHN